MELKLNASRNAIPFFDCWVGAWAMHEPNFHQLQEQLQKLNLSIHLAGIQEHRQEALDQIDDSFAITQEGIGIINLVGPLMKQASSFSSSCSTIRVRQELNRMANNPSVLGIMLKIDSPGGTVAGTKDLADAVAKANLKKPVLAYCSDLTASAAYWIASQCRSIEASESTFVGSIGTYCVVNDTSKAAEDIGVKVHVVRAGEFKGAATPGTEVTVEHLDEIQKQVYGLNQFFIDAVSTGRKMSMDSVSSLADGRVHLAKDAKKFGLIDEVSSFEDCFERFVNSVSVSPASRAISQGDVDMSTENTAKPVTISDLEIKFPKAEAGWKLTCLKNGFTMEQCTESYCSIMQAEVAAANTRAEAAERKAAKPGVSPLKSGRKYRSEDMKPVEEEDDVEATDDMDEDEGDAVSAWDHAVSREMKLCQGNRQKALSQANRKNPGLRVQMLEQVNSRRGRAARR